MTVQEAQAALEKAARSIHDGMTKMREEHWWRAEENEVFALFRAIAALDEARKEEAVQFCETCRGMGVLDSKVRGTYKDFFALRQCEACHGTGRKETP